MQFTKYQHIEHLNSPQTEGILEGEIYVFPKLDGTNCQVWLGEDGLIKCGSRNREITETDHFGFKKYIQSHKGIKEFFDSYPNVILYGEWLVPHTLKTYIESAWGKFYVFDVCWIVDGTLEYAHYNSYTIVLKQFGIDYIPALWTLNNVKHIEILFDLMDKNIYLIKRGCGIGEGLVIKNYNYKNKFGDVIWAKLIDSDFKANYYKKNTTTIKEKSDIENKIVDKYLTEHEIEKEFAKLNIIDVTNKSFIPCLLSTIYYNFIKDNTWKFIKEFHNPTINYRLIQFHVYNKIKSTLPELFMTTIKKETTNVFINKEEIQ